MNYLKQMLKFHTQSELSRLLGFKSRSTISNWLKAGKVPEHMKGKIKKLAERL